MLLKGKEKPYNDRDNEEYWQVVTALLERQTIFVPFDQRLVKHVVTYMDHESLTLNSKQRVPKRFQKPLPPGIPFESLVPSWYSAFINKTVMNDAKNMVEL